MPMPKYKILETRTVKEFLWLPRKVKGHWYWLISIQHFEFLILNRLTGRKTWIRLDQNKKE